MTFKDLPVHKYWQPLEKGMEMEPMEKVSTGKQIHLLSTVFI